MDLTEKQQKGLNIAVQRYRDKKPYSVIAGYAGTGKSTLVQFIIKALNVREEDVVYCAFTGKATLVLSNKGCKNTSTLHKLLYYAHLLPNGSYHFIPRPSLEYPYKIIVVDEVSMLSQELWDTLLKHHIYVLALGDPGQLGPVKAKNNCQLLQSPHIFLDEIMRQEEDNEIIALSMNIRTGKQLQVCENNNVKVYDTSSFVPGMLEWADQVLCATNKTRFFLNMQMRMAAGRTQHPEIEDKVICLKNYWHIISDQGNPLVNGTIGYLTSLQEKDNIYLKCKTIVCNFESETGEVFKNLEIDYKLLTENESSISTARMVKLTKNNKGWMIPKEFSFGYAITTWKAQGSEWDKVLLFEENYPFDNNEHRRYLYTGITRASDKIIVIKK